MYYDVMAQIPKESILSKRKIKFNYSDIFSLASDIMSIKNFGFIEFLYVYINIKHKHGTK